MTTLKIIFVNGLMVTLCLIFIFFVGCQNSEKSRGSSRLYINGDAKSVGASIYIDGKKVGIMEKRVYSGSDSSAVGMKKGDVFAIGVDIRITNKEKKPEYGIYNQIRVLNGKHEILFLNVKENKHLKKTIDIHSEGYIAVDFEKMTIRGGN